MKSSIEPIVHRLFVLVLGLLFLSACHDKSKLPAPNKVIPNSSELTAALLKAKYTSEKEASQARRLLRIRLKDGEGLYDDARAAHNLAISQMRQALVQPEEKPLSPDGLNKLLSDADAKRNKFHSWCSKSYREENNNGEWGSASGVVDVPLELTSLYTEWVNIQEAREQQQRKVILDDLDKCRWASWKDVRSQ